MSSVIVVGGGKVGAHLASLLIEGLHDVRVVEARQERVAELRTRFGEGAAVEGSGTEAAVLERAGVRGCDVVAAVTGADETNLVVAALARFEFGVPRVIARVVDPGNAWLFGADMGVDVALNQADLLAHLVAEEMSLGEMTILLKLRRGQYSLVEEKVAMDSPAARRTVDDVAWPARCQILALIRGGNLIPVEGAVILEAGDEVLAIAHSDAAQRLAALLGPHRDEGG
ncbi:MAG TPA: TrkA family potassium uptake protein [Acidimicrobiia bacterium]|jgi:trk system potassium uptake protein TrkA